MGEYGTPAALQKGERVYPGDAQAAQTLRGSDGAGGPEDAETGRESERGLAQRRRARLEINMVLF